MTLTPTQKADERIARTVRASGSRLDTTIKTAIDSYANILPAGICFTLADLAELIRTWYASPQNYIVADVLDCMSDFYGSFLRLPSGQIKQVLY